ncbi:response regulator transcription factor [bacterium SCSIO 12741]|nr:response regulator transcription factor [bacterium SCSIO 12741]
MNLPYKALIIDDEKLARHRLREMLKPYQEWVEVIGEAENGKKGLEQIEELQPDLLFLDIQMPVMSGFEMLQHLKQSPKIIFVTAFEEYALKAFEQNSIDYLLKPIVKSRLAITMEKLKEQSRYGQWSANTIMELVEANRPAQKLQSLSVMVGDRLVILKLNELVYFKAEDKYVTVYLKNGKTHLLNKSLTRLEKELPADFLRIHRTYMINRNYALEMRRGFNYKWSVVMDHEEGVSLPCGNSYVNDLKESFGSS